MSNKWYNHSYEISGSDNNVTYNGSFDTTFDYNHTLFLPKSLILPVNIRNVKVPCSMSRTLSSLCRCMRNLPRLQILALSNVQTCPHTLVDTWREYRRLASHIVVCQRYRTPVQSNWSPFLWEEVMSATPMTLFLAAGSSTSLIFGGALTLVSLSFPGLLQLITWCADY